MKSKKLLLSSLGLICIVLFFVLMSSTNREISKEIKGLQYGDSIKKIRIGKSNNNYNPYDSEMKLDNITFTIVIKENELTDDEILELGESIKSTLDEEINDITNPSTGNELRLGMSISPVSNLDTKQGEEADGICYYREYDCNTNKFVWTSWAYEDVP